MKWNTISPLTNPSVRFAHVEKDTINLFDEFLKGFFDGQEHDIDDQSEKFPEVEFSFQQGRLSQPISKGISVSWIKPKMVKSHQMSRSQRRFYMPIELTFHVRVGGTNSGDGGPSVVVKDVDDILYALLSSREQIRFLAQKGIHHIRPSSPVMVPNPENPTRQINVSATVQYVQTILTEEDYPEGAIVTHTGAALVLEDGTFLVA